MANVTRRRTGEFLRKAFELLLKNPDGVPAKDVLEYITKNMDLTDYESGSYASTPNDSRLNKIVRFATIDLVKAGWMLKVKGSWIVTDLGRDAYKKYPDPEEFYKQAVTLYHIWKKSRPTVIEAEIEPAAKDFTTFEEAEEESWDQIKGYLLRLGPYDFQQLVADLLTAMDYHVAWISPPGRDKGIDIIAYNDPLGTSNPRIKVQVKHKNSTVTSEGLRSFLSVLGSEEVGIFVSSGGFTSDAREEARTQERRKITLLDLEQFFDLWVQYYDKLAQDARQRFPLKPIYYLDLEE